jgi:16S rRNA (guanine966-N2)-methyltransferase
MRIVAGAFGGRKLRTPPAKSGFRPTTDRVRESLFNILDHAIGLNGKTICDLFAGTGSLGIEALSRGAKHAVFVEKDPRHAALIKENVAALDLKESTDVHVVYAEKYLQTAAGRFDVIFCDPPYGYGEAGGLFETIAARKLLSPSGMLCFEHGGKEVLVYNKPWAVREIRTYGTTAVSLMTIEE